MKLSENHIIWLLAWPKKYLPWSVSWHPYRVTPQANPRVFRRRLLHATLLELKRAAYGQ